MGMFTIQLTMGAVLLVAIFVMDIGVGFSIGLVVSYFVPTLLAIYKKHGSTNRIFILNLLLGWTVIGWGVAFFWVFKNQSSKNEIVPILGVHNSYSALALDRDSVYRSNNSIEKSIVYKVSDEQNKLNTALENWLLARWEMIAEGGLTPKGWYFRDPTDRQISKLREYGLVHSAKNRGQYSDIIGLFEDPRAEDIVILKFFKQSVRSLSQTQARHLVEVIENDPVRMAVYVNRPAGSLQKKMYDFCGIKAPSSLKMSQFESDYDSMSEDPKFAEGVTLWEEYVELFEELQDKDVMLDYGIKRVSLSVFDSAIKSLINSGIDKSDAVSDLDLIVDKILEIKPELKR